MFIGFLGLQGSGKTTAADWCVDRFYGNKYSIAGTLKEVTYQLYGKCERSDLQKVGGVLKHGIDDELFIRPLIRDMLGFLHAQKNVFVDDIRFPDEIRVFRSLGFKIVGIERRLIDVYDCRHQKDESIDDFCHNLTKEPSERLCLDLLTPGGDLYDTIGLYVDYLIKNNGTLEDFYRELKLKLIPLTMNSVTKKQPQGAKEQWNSQQNYQ